MNLKSPMSTAIPGVPGVVLAILAATTQPLTGRTVAALGGQRTSQSGTNRVLRELVDQGLVTEVSAGRAKLYSLNRDHVAAASIEALSSLTETLYERIRAEVSAWSTPPVAVLLFGSAARSEATADSDIDLLVIRPGHVEMGDDHWREQVSDLAAAIHRWSGNECEILEYSPDELSLLESLKDPLAASLRRDGQLLYGSNMAELLETTA